jgi:hydroxymethylpyrimidine/phosphomethylpyrimidine kinase
VLSVRAIEPAMVTQQLQAVWEQVRPDAICIGLIPGVASIAAIARFLRRLHSLPPVVVDPVVAATSGRRLLGPREIRALHSLLGLATIVTPNLSEAAALTGLPVFTPVQAQRAALALCRTCPAVLVTGGHGVGTTCVDVLATRSSPKARPRKPALLPARIGVQRFSSRRLHGTMRGTGGMLAAALAVELARGRPLDMAVRRARRFVRDAWPRARPVGSGRPQYLG